MLSENTLRIIFYVLIVVCIFVQSLAMSKMSKIVQSLEITVEEQDETILLLAKNLTYYNNLIPAVEKIAIMALLKTNMFISEQEQRTSIFEFK